MIVSLYLKCFRKHTDTKIDFSSGLNVLRGANESGKSTVLEGMLYALYGAKVLRNTLAETVTWGHKEGELKAELVLRVGAVLYTFTRSKSGCECSYSGNKVVGHTEVSAFAADLLGADAKTAALLMLSSQSGLRGALDDGPAAVSGLMGRLADFDLIDRIVDAAQSKLLLGNAAPFQSKLEDAERTLATLQASPVDPEPVTMMGTDIDARRSLLAELQQNLAQVEPDFHAVERQLVDAIASNEKRGRVVTRIAELHAQIGQAKTQAGQAQAQAAAVRPAAGVVAAAEAAAAAAGSVAATLDLWRAVQGAPRYPEEYWDEPKASLEAAVAGLRAEEGELSKLAQEGQQEAKALRRNLIREGKCPTCGHDAANDEHVRQLNAETERLAAEADAAAKKATAGAELIREGQQPLLTLLRAGEPLEVLANRLEGRHAAIVVDRSIYPPRVQWEGPAPVADDGSAARALAELRRAAQQAAGLDGQAKAHNDAALRFEAEVWRVQEELTALPEIDTKDLQTRYNSLVSTYGNLKADIETQSAALSVAQNLYAQAKGALDLYEQRLADVKARIAEHTEDLRKLEFNNALVKKLRGLKPAITDHLWNTVLTAVSNFFSQLRGENSVVTKTAAGFRVNDQSIESLSGSTIDVLALAVRVALTKTFIPHASFLVLDEPAHGCDNDRTSNVLGFLSSVGFAQTLLASHDELSESVADNVIILGV